MQKHFLLILLLLFGCQSASLDEKKDTQETINMTFCDAGGLKRFSPVVNHGQPMSFTCNNGLSGSLPTQSIFESDESYLTKYFEQFLMLKLERCTQDTDEVTHFSVLNSGSKLRYYMACKKTGRFSVDVSYFDSLSEQSQTITRLESMCESEPFRLIDITNQSPLKRTYRFMCGRAVFNIDSSITTDDIFALDALYCDCQGFNTLTATQVNSISNTKQASFSCRNGLTSTIKF